jgi:hypothetical protein
MLEMLQILQNNSYKLMCESLNKKQKKNKENAKTTTNITTKDLQGNIINL